MTQPTQKDREAAKELLRVHTFVNQSLNDADVVMNMEDFESAISHAIAKAREEEREECAKAIAPTGNEGSVLRDAADRIRARKHATEGGK